MTVLSVNEHYKNPTNRVGLVQNKHHYHLIVTCSHRDIAEKLHLVLKNNRSLTHSLNKQ